MDKLLEKLITAADHHADDSGEPDHAVGDLQDLLREAWALMLPSQKQALLEGDAVENLVETGARDAFDARSLQDELQQSVRQMQDELALQGYSILKSTHGFYWKTADDEGEGCHARADAVASAYRHARLPR
jgi:hypothetical protein